jgi:OOP family OmpA-OmpF porin
VNTVKRSGVAPAAMTIVGHTDSRGSKRYNQGLSERRAQSVADYLAAQGLTTNNIQVSGRGESEPVASNKSRAGRAQNRRVNIQVNGQRRVTR